MRIIRTLDEFSEFNKRVLGSGKTVGFVPTMGFLHGGHLSLIKKSVSDNNFTVVSIYVNPTQFLPGEDLDSYPRDIERDIQLLKQEDVDLLFLPDDTVMYHPDHEINVSPGSLGNELCGKSRPGHFVGVLTIVLKLLNVIKPDRAYFGKKDYQQYVLIKKMVRDLNLNVSVIGMPLIREENGLAMSSRNQYLNDDEKKQASELFQALNKMLTSFHRGVSDVEVLTHEGKAYLESVGKFQTEYLEIRNKDTLGKINKCTRDAVILVAVRFADKVRLIDVLEVD